MVFLGEYILNVPTQTVEIRILVFHGIRKNPENFRMTIFSVKPTKKQVCCVHLCITCTFAYTINIIFRMSLRQRSILNKRCSELL